MAEAPPIQSDQHDVTRQTGGDQDMLWSQVWQLPVLLLGLGLLVIGVYLALPEKDPDDFHGRLANIETMIDKQELEQAEAALELIEERIHEAPGQEQGYFWELFADLNFQKLYETGVVGRHGIEAALPTYEKIVEYYGNAKDKGRELDGPSLRQHVRSLVALGRDQQALAIMDRMTGDQAAQRYLILRDMIERRRLDKGVVDQSVIDTIKPLMDRFREDIKALPDKSIARKQDIWADGFHARLLMQVGHPQGAINYLLLRIQRLASQGTDKDLAPLMVKLAQAYQAIDDHQNARQRFMHAQGLVDAADDLNAEILVGLGRLALSQSTGQDIEQALEYFREAEQNYPSATDAHIAALIGRADCEAHLGDHAAAVHYFDLAVREIKDFTRSTDKRREELSQIISVQFQRAVDLDEYDRAKDYLDVQALLEGKQPSESLLLNLAMTCEKIGDQLDEMAKQSMEPGPGRPPLSAEARRLAFQQAAQSYAQAAGYYYQHAMRVTIENNEMHGDSLWNSAVNYDRALMWPEAIKVYEQYVTTRDGDPRRLRALRNLAQAYMSDGQYAPALAKFNQLVDDAPRSPETYTGLVLMAKCFDELGQTERAVDTLNRIIDDHEAITPDSQEYRQALVALGKLYHRQGEQEPALYARAIELLAEALQRYGQTEDGPVLHYLLADAHRRSVAALEDQINRTQSQAEQLALEAERKDRLNQAQMLYNQAISGLEAKRAAMLTLEPIEDVYLRNAYFYQADCAYDRGVYEQAIQLYNTAASTYSDNPASLIAWVQIVNAHCELGQFRQAKVANDNARRQLERIPDSAFEDENLPMKREHWEDWLRWTSERNLFSQANAGG